LKSFRNWSLLVPALFLLGCAHYPVNAKLNAYDRDVGYRFKNLSSQLNTDSLFVILAFSGGGTRAAALSYGVLEKLRDTTITWKGERRRLLDEVDVISSVSGGSFTAAYYGLHGYEIFQDFEARFLKRNIEWELAQQMLVPTNWFRLASPMFDRIDLAAEYYDSRVFNRGTFHDLERKGQRPFILINATDMTLGARFEFTQDQFDLLCSNLSEVPVARAVAASSAFPVLLSPLTLKNYAGTCDFQEPEWVTNAMDDRDIAARRFNEAVQTRSYLDMAKRPYLHLLDGGIADNIGLRGPLRAILSLDGGWSVLRMVNMNKVEKIVVIVVNARTEPDTTFDQKENAPGWKDVLMTVATVPMDNYSFETIELLAENSKQWQKDYQARRACEQQLQARCPGAELPGGQLANVDFYPIVVAFDSLPDPGERSFFKNLPTTFNLAPETVDRLRSVGARLVSEAAGFRDLIGELQ
jgi:NTE family protein